MQQVGRLRPMMGILAVDRRFSGNDDRRPYVNCVMPDDRPQAGLLHRNTDQSAKARGEWPTIAWMRLSALRTTEPRHGGATSDTRTTSVTSFR
jgi:hypothetical protein